jgi:hypothetical protein
LNVNKGAQKSRRTGKPWVKLVRNWKIEFTLTYVYIPNEEVQKA